MRCKLCGAIYVVQYTFGRNCCRPLHCSSKHPTHPPATWSAKLMRTSTSALASGPRWRRTDPSCRTRDGGDDVDDGNDDSGGDGNDHVHGDDDGDEDDGEDDDVDDDGAGPRVESPPCVFVFFYSFIFSGWRCVVCVLLVSALHTPALPLTPPSLSHCLRCVMFIANSGARASEVTR